MIMLLQKYFFLILPFIFIFVSSIYKPYDADLGWHLKYGEHFIKTGQILKENSFSSEMPGFIWANTSWGTDILTHLFYNTGGFFGISILGAIVITLTFFIYSKAFKLTFFEQAIIFPLVVLFENPVNQVSFRGQLLSLMFLGILLVLLTRYEEGKKKLLFLSIPLFLIWANMHGQYILGLGIFLLWIFFYLLKKYLLDKTSVKIFLFGILTLFFTDKLKEKLPYVGISTVLYSLSWYVRRYAWAMYYTAFPLIQPVANFLKPDSEKATKITATVLFIFYIGIVFMFKYPFSQFTSMNWDIFCQDYLGCSPKSVEFLINNKLDKDLLTFYNWGGYIIWNYPQIKPSIDGRMHLWIDNKGYSAFSYYYPFEQNLEDIDQSKYNAVLISQEKPLYDRLTELTEEKKWKHVYEDEKAAVFVRNIPEYQNLYSIGINENP